MRTKVSCLSDLSFPMLLTICHVCNSHLELRPFSDQVVTLVLRRFMRTTQADKQALNTPWLPGLGMKPLYWLYGMRRRELMWGPRYHQQTVLCAILLTVHCRLLGEEIAGFTLACDNRCSLCSTNQ